MLESLSKEHYTPTREQLQETNRIVEEIILNCSPETMRDLFSGDTQDCVEIYEILFEETFQTLFGSYGNIQESTSKYLHNLYETMEETLRVENLNYFLTSLFTDFDINWHHLEWGSLALKHRLLCIEAARDHGKSYYWSNIYPIWKMYRYQQKNSLLRKPRRDLQLSERGFIISNEMGLGIELLDILKTTVENNPILSEKLLPSDKNNWGKLSIKTKNGCKLAVKSLGSRFRGRHPGWVVIDDFLDDSNIYSKDRREKAINYFHSVIMNAVLNEGSVVVVGTPFHANDLYGDLKTKKEEWRVFEYPSLYPDGSVLWENRYDLKSLISKKNSQGSLIFSREHLCRPIVSDAAIFSQKILQKSTQGMENYRLVNNRESFPIKFAKVVTGCDFAMSSSVGADYSVFTTWGVDERNEMWLLNIWRAKGKSLGEQIAAIKSIHRNFRPDVITMENNQFQQIFVDEADKLGLPIHSQTTGRNKHDLKKGLPSLVIMFERGRFHFPTGDSVSKTATDMILSEFSNIAWTDKGLQGVGDHDDIPMSCWIAYSGALKISGGGGFGFL